MEELVEEILLRFPPHEPACLVRAALVCKRWCRLVSGPGFRRRFREFHRMPPLAGVPPQQPPRRFLPQRRGPLRAHNRLCPAARRAPPLPRARRTPRSCAPGTPWEKLCGGSPRGLGPHHGRAEGAAGSHAVRGRVLMERGGCLCRRRAVRPPRLPRWTLPRGLRGIDPYAHVHLHPLIQCCYLEQEDLQRGPSS
jgi:hypothetical protein